MLSGDAMRSSVGWKLPVNPFQDQKHQLLPFRTVVPLWAQRQASNQQTVLRTFAAGWVHYLQWEGVRVRDHIRVRPRDGSGGYGVRKGRGL